MKIIDLIESRNKVFTLMYHGTTDTFLKNILKNGLMPSGSNIGYRYIKSPTPKKVPISLPKNFGSSDPIYLSFQGGVYITTDIDTAKEAARSASEIHEGNPILIEILHLTTSGVLDEDHVFRKFLNNILVEYTVRAINIEYYSKQRVKEINKNFISDDKILQNFLNFVKESIKWGSRMTRKSELIIKEFFVKAAIAVIKLFNEVTNGYTPSTCTYYCKQIYLNLLMNEKELRNLIKDFIDTTKVFNPEGPVRITRPIKFKGNTRIIRITDLLERKVFYSDPNYLNSLKQIELSNIPKKS